MVLIVGAGLAATRLRQESPPQRDISVLPES